MEDLVKTKNGFVLNDENECMIAEITYVPYGEDKVIANHTYVDSSLETYIFDAVFPSRSDLLQIFFL